MTKAIQNFPMSMQVPVKDYMEIGLRSTAALTQIACEAEGRFGTLQTTFLRSALNNYSQASRQWLSDQPTGDADVTVEAMKHALSYWRSLAGLMATTQAEVADQMGSSLREMAELTDNSSSKDSPDEPANLPLALYTATGTNMLTTAQAMCKQIGQSAREFTAQNGGESGFALMASNEQKGGNARTRSNHRKAA